MSKEAARKRVTAREPENFVGFSYTCCSGPRRGQAITVVERAPDGKRYHLEAEKGGRWTIAAEKLRKIFGPAGERSCQCSPLRFEPPETVEGVAAATEPASTGAPPKIVTVKEMTGSETLVAVSPAEAMKADESPVVEIRIQGTLF